MDSLSKNVYLIGILHIVAYLFIAVRYLTEAFIRIDFNNYDKLRIYSGSFLNGVCFVALAALAGLMNRGVVQKRHKLLAPFFYMIVLYLSFETISFLWENIRFGTLPWPIYYHEDLLYKIGITILSVYPIYTLYKKLRLNQNQRNHLKKQISPN